MVSTTVLGGGVVFILVIVIFFLLTKKKESPVALQPQNYQKFKLISKRSVSPNTYIFRYSLQSSKHKLGLPIGKHMYLRFIDNSDPANPNQVVSRPYTPISSDDDLGFFDLLIKVYPLGKMGNYLLSKNIGEDIEVRGPAGKLSYHGHHKFNIAGVDRKIKHLGMIAGGTGITPMLQIIRAVQKDASDPLPLSLIFANVTQPDILLHDELIDAEKAMKNFKLHLTLDKPSEGWKGGSGYVTVKMIEENLPAAADDVLICLCGPKPMVDMLKKHLATLGHKEENVFMF